MITGQILVWEGDRMQNQHNKEKRGGGGRGRICPCSDAWEGKVKIDSKNLANQDHAAVVLIAEFL